MRFGYENFLSPNSDYSDFEIHRAQQRHYDAFTSVMVEIGPGTWTFPSSGERSPTSGASSSSSSSEASSGGDKPVVHNAGPVKVGPAAGVVISRNGNTIWVDGPSRKEPEEIEDWGPGGTPVAEPLHDATRTIRTLPGPFGPITIYPHPDASDVENAAEQRLGDGPQTWIYGVWTDIADWAYTLQYGNEELQPLINDAYAADDARRAANWRANHEALTQQWQDFNVQFPLVPDAYR